MVKFQKISDSQYAIGDLHIYAHLVKDSKGRWGLFIDRHHVLFLADELEEILAKIKEMNR